MRCFTSLQTIKKGEWLAGTITACFLSVAVCLFQNHDASTFREPAFRQFVICSFAFFCTAACVFVTNKLWILTAVALCGGVLVGVFAPSAAVPFFAVLLPGLLWLALLRNFTNNERPKLFLPLFCARSALLTAAIGVLITKIQPVSGLLSFFRPASNKDLKELWFLVFFLILFAGIFFPMPRKDKDSGKNAAHKKRRGKTTASSRNQFLVISSVLTLLFVTDATLLHVFYWYSNEAIAPYSLLIDFCCLFILFCLFAFPKANE